MTRSHRSTRVAPRLALVAGLVTLLLPTLACTSIHGVGEIGKELFNADPDHRYPSSDEYVQSEPLDGTTVDHLWGRARIVLPNEGYVVEQDSERTSFGERRMASRWNTYLAPNARAGVRRRALVEFHPAGRDQWIVAVAVQKQINTDIDDPMNPGTADWEPDGVDRSRSDVLLWKLTSFASENPYE